VDQIFAGVIVILLIGVVTDQIIRLLNKALFPWKE
jgi:ABC-type nitrate/sulfonate/bicarbonate transport system permease component